jgi:CRP/FNR family transcriptional regulator, cyclic AMP receptor protein
MENKKNIHSSFWSNFFTQKDQNAGAAHQLKKLPPFAELGSKDLQLLQNLLHKRNYIPGEYIFHQGDPGIGVYLIEEGTVEIQRTDEFGNAYSLALFSQGDFFGELALVDGAKRSASAIATSDARLNVLFKPDLDEFINKYPKKGVKILQGFSLIIISRLRKLNEDCFYLHRELKQEKIHGTEY